MSIYASLAGKGLKQLGFQQPRGLRCHCNIFQIKINSFKKFKFKLEIIIFPLKCVFIPVFFSFYCCEMNISDEEFPNTNFPSECIVQAVEVSAVILLSGSQVSNQCVLLRTLVKLQYFGGIDKARVSHAVDGSVIWFIPPSSGGSPGPV